MKYIKKYIHNSLFGAGSFSGKFFPCLVPVLFWDFLENRRGKNYESKRFYKKK